MIYEISNPSDAYTMKSDDPAAACAACLLLGEGAYPMDDENGQTVAPFLLFGGGDLQESVKKLHGITLDDIIEQRLPAVRDAMASVLIGDRTERIECDAALERMPESEREEYLNQRHDRLRSSMNDIGKRAQQLSVTLSKKVAASEESAANHAMTGE